MKVIKTDNGITTLEHDGMDFKVYDEAIAFYEECIGVYVDKEAYEKKIIQGSDYGLLIVEALNEYYKKQWGCKG